MNIDGALNKINNTWNNIPYAILNGDNEIIRRIRLLSPLNLTIKKMSTANIGLLINLLCSELENDEAYVNIGVWNGYSYFAGIIGNRIKAIANDAFQVCTGNIGFWGEPAEIDVGNTREIFLKEFYRLADPTLHSYYIEDCWTFLREYSNRKLPKIGFYFYDGDHSYDNQIKALEYVEPYLADRCVILIDDLNMPDVLTANERYFSKNTHYTRLLSIHTPCDGWPTWWNGIQLWARRYK